MHKRMLVAIVILFGFIMTAPLAWGLTVTYTGSPAATNYAYNFTLNNDLGQSIYEMLLVLPVSDASLTNFGSPANWGDGSSGSTQPLHGAVLSDTSFVEWYAELGSELPDGALLDGFRLECDRQITESILFSVNSDPTLGGTAGPSGTSPVPEPATFSLVGIGLAAIRRVRRRVV